jgi:uncharacterized membrane protein YoaK (UPF0700 family)
MAASPADDRASTFSFGNDRLPFVLVILTFVTGIVDAVSFLGLGRIFTANMTGNIVFLGFAVVGIPGLSVGRSLTSLVAFAVGAALGGRLASYIAVRRRRWLVVAAAIEGGLLFAAAFVSIGSDVPTASPSGRLYLIIILTALAMGLRNATVRRLAVPDLTTTVLTLTVTGLAADSSFAGGNNPRLVRRAAAVFSMFAGAAVGALLLRHNVALPLIVSAGCVILATFVIPPVSDPQVIARLRNHTFAKVTAPR